MVKIKETSFFFTRKMDFFERHCNLANDYCFVPVGIESFGSWGAEGQNLIKAIGKRISIVTGEKKSTSFLFQ